MIRRIAIVHDWFTIPAGAEKIVRILCELFPQADLFSLVYDKNTMGDYLKGKEVQTSFIQRLPFGRKKYQSYLPLMPLAVEQFDLRGYDLVISSSTSIAKGVITDSDTPHICYCNTPMRYAWDLYHEYLELSKINGLKRTLVALIMNYMRIWDRLSADRVDYFLANSHNVAHRIKKHYRRDSIVIYPPVNTDFYKPLKRNKGDYFLIVSRLVPYKRVDIAVETFNKLGLPLVIVGDGSEALKLRKLAGENIIFTGRISDEKIRQYYADCRAFIFTSNEDFGITPVEAMACGKPVIAYRAGGALETVIEEKTGVFFEKQNSESLITGIKKFLSLEDKFEPGIIRKQALKFSEERFKEEIYKCICDKYKEFNNRVVE